MNGRNKNATNYIDNNGGRVNDASLLLSFRQSLKLIAGVYQSVIRLRCDLMKVDGLGRVIRGRWLVLFCEWTESGFGVR
jgi:hypothetical protein